MEYSLKIGDYVKLNTPPYTEFCVEGFTDRPYTEINSQTSVNKTLGASREYVICRWYNQKEDCFKVAVFNYTYLDKIEGRERLW